MNCEKCGKPIESKKDSAIWLAIEAGQISSLGLLIYSDRHIRCSPSRAQHIVHPDFQPEVFDDRQEYDKRLMTTKERELYKTSWTNAWLRLQQEEK